MKLDYTNDKRELLSVTLLGISVVLSILICMKAFSYYKLSAKANHIENVIQTIKSKDSCSSEDMKKYLEPTKEMANNIKKRNLLAPPQPKRNPVTQIPCILGDEVFINNKWYKEGDMVQDAKIVSIEPAQVTIEWEGKKSVLQPLGAKVASNGSGGPQEAPVRPERTPTSRPRVVAKEGPSEEQPTVPEEMANPDVVMMEPPWQGGAIGQIDEKMMEQIQNIDPAMLENVPIEQREQIQNMIRMRMERN